MSSSSVQQINGSFRVALLKDSSGPNPVLRINARSLYSTINFWPSLLLVSLWHHAPMRKDEHAASLLDVSRSALIRAATRLLGPADAEDAVQDA